LNTSTSTLRTDLGTAETDITNLETSTSTIEGNLNSEISTRISEDNLISDATGQIRTDFEAYDSTLNTSTSTLRTDLETAELAITNLETSTATLQSNIDGLNIVYLGITDTAVDSSLWKTMDIDTTTLAVNDLLRFDGSNLVRVASGTVANTFLKQDFTWDTLAGGGAGDMLKAVYDTGEDGTVDDSEALGGEAGSYYAIKADVISSTDTLGTDITNLETLCSYFSYDGVNYELDISTDINIAGEATASSFTIGANTLETSEFGYLDGVNQSVGTGDDVTHKNVDITYGMTTSTITADSGIITNGLTVGSITYSAVQTTYITISPADWLPVSDVGLWRVSKQEIGSSHATTAAVVYAPVHMPNGSTITDVTAYWYRDDALAAGSLNMFVNNLADHTQTTMSANDSGVISPTYHTTQDITITSATVNNATSTYSFGCTIDPNDNNSDVALQSVVITCETTSPLD